MDRVLDVSKYMYSKYKDMYNEEIDELKLHKLLYLAQRESFAITNSPLFDGQFEGWKHGPVCKIVRSAVHTGEISRSFSEISPGSMYVVNNILIEYGKMQSWELSNLTHNESSWKKARTGLLHDENGTQVIKLEDIREDSRKVRPYDHVWDMYYDEFEDA